MKHMLKTDPGVFAMSKAGLKTFEIRYDDRGYEIGDMLVLRETRYSGEEMKSGKPLIYTEDIVICIVQYILRGPAYGLEDGWVIMSVNIL